MAVDEPVQPEGEGQGGESGDSPYQEYLDRITDEEARGIAEEGFRAFDGNATRRFQEAAEYKTQWKPFEALGVNQRDPAEIEWALQVADAATQNPAEFQKWVNNDYAQQHGLTAQEQQELAEEFVDPSVDARVEQLLQAQLGPQAQQLQELVQWREAQETQAREDQAAAQIRSELDDLKAKHGDAFDEEFVEMLIPRHMETPEQAVQLAFQDSQKLRSKYEKLTLNGKLNTPPGAESGGKASSDREEPKTLAEAEKSATAMLRAARQQ